MQAINLKHFWNKLFLILGTSCFLAFLLIFMSVSWDVVVDADFVNYFVGGLVVRKDGTLLYDIAMNKSLQDELLYEFPARNITIFRAIPPAALIYLPLTYLPFISAYKIFALINFLVLVVISLISASIFKKLKGKVALVLLLSFLYFPALQTIANGQLSIIMTLITLLIYKAISEGKDYKAGILSSLLLLKAQFIILAPFLLVLSRKKLKFFLGLSYAGLVMLAISVLVAGPEWLIEYPKFLLATEGPSFGSRISEMWTFTGALNVFNISMSFLINAALYILSLFMFIKFYKPAKRNIFFASAVLLSAFFSMHLLSHDLAIFLVPLVILINKAFENSLKNKYLFFAGVLYFLPYTYFIIPPGILAAIFATLGIYLIFSK